jgi:hypothetical protein
LVTKNNDLEKFFTHWLNNAFNFLKVIVSNF